MNSIIYCAGCNFEEAVELMDVECNGEIFCFPVGEVCLTRASENARIEE